MSDELSIYKQNRINVLINNSNNTILSLNNILKNNINTIKNSNVKNKPLLINSLINKYNYNISNIKNNLNIGIKNINSSTPEFNIIKINKKKALIIGINYIGTPYELSGCINDTTNITNLLTQHGFNDFVLLTDNTTIKPTKENILNELKNLIINANSGDILFFYFSGHGSYTCDLNNDETDGKDEMIISYDIQGVIDDELKKVISDNLKKDITIVGLFDSCHSGTILDLRYNYLDSDNYDKYFENLKETECEGNVIMISGCMDDQTSDENMIDKNVQGAMTWSFIQSINQNPNSSWRELLKSMRDLLKNNSFSQIPQLSTDSFYDIDTKIFI
jgi:hypothetical protein